MWGARDQLPDSVKCNTADSLLRLLTCFNRVAHKNILKYLCVNWHSRWANGFGFCALPSSCVRSCQIRLYILKPVMYCRFCIRQIGGQGREKGRMKIYRNLSLPNSIVGCVYWCFLFSTVSNVVSDIDKDNFGNFSSLRKINVFKTLWGVKKAKRIRVYQEIRIDKVVLSVVDMY